MGTPAAGAGVAPAAVAPTVARPVPPAPPAPGVDVDSTGLPWDPRIHSGGKAKIAAGTWPPAGEQAEAEKPGWCSFGEDDAPGAGCIKPAGHTGAHLVTPGDVDDE